jgi:hypothetical protein
MTRWHYIAITGAILVVCLGIFYVLYPRDEVCKPQETAQSPLREEETASYTISFLKYLKAHVIGESRKTIENNRTDQGDYYACRLASYTKQLSIFTAALVVVTAFLFAIGVYQGIQLSRHASHMESSATEASRAATAMESVAVGIGESVKNTRDLMESQRGFWQRQMRAYLSVRFGGVVLQDNTTNYRFEVRMILANTGHTPADEVNYRAVADVLPFPLPDDFTFSMPDIQITSGGVLGPQQVFTMGAFVDRMYTDEEIAEISTGTVKRLYIYGTVRYRDAFGSDRYTNFSQRVEWMRGGQFTGFNTRRHNDAT